MKIYKINVKSDFGELCKYIAPRKIGEKIMQKKSEIHFFLLRDIKSPAANILKQDALSIGAELVTSENVIMGSGISNALLMANQKQIEALAKKEILQDFGLKDLAKFLQNQFNKPTKPQIMGVVNLNDDSFNAQSRAKGQSAIEKIILQIENGADFIDIGAVSSRPGSLYPGKDEEFARLKDVVAEIYRQNLHEKAKFSLDSYDEYCVEYALNHGFCLVNDISANLSLGKLVKKYNAKYCLMHMQGNPENMQKAPSYADLIGEIDEFFAGNLAKLKEMGVEDVLLDIGIGFGKTAEQNMLLIKHLEHFLHFGKPLFVGASRKSVINFYSKSEVADRLPGSLYLHLEAFKNGASIIRTHDVAEHKQMFDMVQAMQNINIW